MQHPSSLLNNPAAALLQCGGRDLFRQVMHGGLQGKDMAMIALHSCIALEADYTVIGSGL